MCIRDRNRRLKEKGSERKKKNDDLISYQSGNETIIMPKRFRESSMWANILYIIIGLVVGVAVTCLSLIHISRHLKSRESTRQTLQDKSSWRNAGTGEKSMADVS